MTDPWARPDQPSQPTPHADAPTEQHLPPEAPTRQDPAVPPQAPPPPPPADAAAGDDAAEGGSRFTRLFKDPLSLVLIAVIVVALTAAGLIVGELYSRNRGEARVADALKCVVQDDVTVSFGGWPPFLVQHMTRHYSDIHIETAGNRVRDAIGMKMDLSIKDVRLEETADAGGTIGSLVADINWSTEGIFQTLQDSVPLFGALITGVQTHPSSGTIEVQGILGSGISTRPTVVNGKLELQATKTTGLGFILPRESIQPILDVVAARLTADYPVPIKADSVRITDNGVQSRFSATDAAIPPGRQDPCFANL